MKRFLLLAATGLPFFCHAAVIGTPMNINISANSTRPQRLFLKNQDIAPRHVRLVLNVLKKPGTPSQKIIQLKETQNKLIIRPTELTLKPHETRAISITPNKKFSNHDQIILLDITTRKRSPPAPNNIKIQYGIRITIRPENPNVSVRFYQENKTLTIKNIGNTNIVLYNGRQCHLVHHCIKLPAKRLYANEKWAISLPYSYFPVHYTAQYGNQIQQLYIRNHKIFLMHGMINIL
jgi:hypothetical protein